MINLSGSLVQTVWDSSGAEHHGCFPRSECWEHQGPDGLPPGSRAQALEEAEPHTEVQMPQGESPRRKGPCSQVTHWAAVLARPPGLCAGSPAEQVPAGPGPASWLADGVQLPPLVKAISSSTSTMIQLSPHHPHYFLSLLEYNSHLGLMNGNANS